MSIDDLPLTLPRALPTAARATPLLMHGSAPLSAPASVPMSGARETMPDVATTAPAVPFIGRGAELGMLRSVWQRASESDEASAVIVAGDAGIGKTRLMSELAREVTEQGGHVLVGHCLGLGQAAPPFLPVLEILAQARDAAPAIATAATDLLDTDVAGDQVRFFDGVHGVLTTAARNAPVLMVVEDLHWSDPSTRDLLLFLLARLGTGRLLLLLTYRTDDLNRAHPLRPWLASVARMQRVDRLDVEPFHRSDAAELVRALLGDAATDDDLVRDVAARSEGNAFFAEELTSAVDGGRAEISDMLASVLLDRIERLSAQAQRVVRAAAIVGQRDLWPSSLERLAASSAVGLQPADVEAALRECVQSHVLVVTSDGAFAFRHALLREAVLTDLLPGEGARLHAAYVPVLSEEQPPGWRAAVAFHAARAGETGTALRAHLDAAAEASAAAAHGDALDHLEKALQLWHAVPEPESIADADELSVTLRACDEAMASGRTDRALTYAKACVAMADDVGTVVQRAGARRRLAKLYYGGDDWREAERLIAQAWSLLEDQPATPERAWVLSTMSFGDPSADRRELAERAIAEARAVGAPGPEADALISLAFLLQHDGDVDSAMERLREACEKASESGADDTELRARFNMAMLRYDHGDIEQAAELASEGVAAAARHGRSWAGYGTELMWLLNVIDIARGHFTDVVARCTESLTSVPHSARGLVHACRALASAWLGDWQRVEDDVAVIAPPETVAQSSLPGGIITPIAGHAIVASWLWRGRPELVESALTQALASPLYPDELAEVRVGAMLLAAKAELARRPGGSGEVGGVEELLERVERVFEIGMSRGASPGPEAHLWLARARAEGARCSRDDPDAWRAVVEAASFGERPNEAYARWRLGEAMLATGDGGGADELEQSLRMAREMSIAPLAAAVEATARRFRVRVAGVTPSGGDVLTPRERSVLELVARGMTNRAVGAELFISEKTVSVHLTRVMAKLGASSRTEAVAIAMSRGLI